MTDGKDAVPPTERDLFLEVMARPAASRENYLRERAGAWPKLVDQVLALLAHTSATECFVAAADAAMDGAAPRAPQSGGDDTATDTVTGSQSTWQAFLEQLREVGCNFARYRHVGDVGHGGQGVILRVEDVVSRRPLAMKRIKRQETTQPGDETPGVDDETLGRFLDEAQIQAQLDHPSIVPVHEIGIDDRGRVYFTMKFVKGESLGKVFDKVRAGDEEWTVERALHSMVRVCEAMAYAHSKGVVHRDLKPGNVMVGRFGEVFVMDWGLARVLGEPDRRDIRVQPAIAQSKVEGERSRQAAETPDQALVTMDGAVLGTPFYMPPEQAAGRIEDVGTAADVYSAGAMLYHLLAGRAPYERPGARVSARTVLELVMQGAPESLTRLTKPPAALVAIVEKAMAREVKDRYPSMVELAKDLRAYLDGRVVQAFGTGVWQELKSFVRRNRAVAMVAVGALVMASGLVWAVVDRENRRAEEAEGRASAETMLRHEKEQWVSELKKALDTERKLTSSNDRITYGNNTNLVSVDVDLRRMVLARERLDRMPAPLRQFEWGHLHLKASTGEPTARLAGCTPGTRAGMPLDCSLVAYPFDRGVATYSSEGGVSKFDVGFEGVDAIAVSGDGSTLGCTNGLDFIVLKGNARESIARWKSDGEPTNRVRMCMDRLGNYLAYTASPCVVVVRNIVSGTERRWEDGKGRAGDWSGIPIAISSDGKSVAFVDSEGRARLWNLDGKGDPASLDHFSPAVDVTFSADGRRLALGCSDGTIPVLDCSSQKQVALLRNDERPGQEHRVAFTPDGTQIVSSGDSKVQVLSLKSGMVQHAIPVGFSVPAVFATADSVHIPNGGTYWTWPFDHTPGESSLTAIWHGYRAEFDPDGGRVAMVCSNAAESHLPPRTVVVVDASTGLPTHAFSGNRFAFSPDRRTIAVAASVQHTTVLGVEYPKLPTNSITLYDLSGQEAPRWLADTLWGVNAIAFSPDGSRLVAATGSVLTDDLIEVFGPDEMVAPGNKNRAGYSTEDNWIQLWDSHDGKLLARVASHDQLATGVGFHPVGKSIYSTGLDGRVCELSGIDLSLMRELIPPSQEPTLVLSVDPRGEFLVVGTKSGRVMWIDLSDGRPLREPDEGGKVRGLAWSADGERLAVLAQGRLAVFFRDGEVSYETKAGGDSVSFDKASKRLLVGDRILETDSAVVATFASNRQTVRLAHQAVAALKGKLASGQDVRDSILGAESIAPEHKAMARVLVDLAPTKGDSNFLQSMAAPGAAASLSPERRARLLFELRQQEEGVSPFIFVALNAVFLRIALGELDDAEATLVRLRKHVVFLRPRVAKALLGQNDRTGSGGMLAGGHISMHVDPQSLVELVDMSADLLEVQILLGRSYTDFARAAYAKASERAETLMESIPPATRKYLEEQMSPLRAEIEAKLNN